MLGRTFYNLPSDFSPWGPKIIRLAKESDFFGVNLETTITSASSKDEYPGKTFRFKMNPDHTHWLSQASIDYASLANNHAYDYTDRGLGDTKRHLDREGVLYSGTKDDPFIMIKQSQGKGTVVGIYAMTDHPSVWAHKLNMVHPGTLDEIKALTKTVDIMIVFVHWGSNWQPEIPADLKALGHALIDAGADIVVGTSAHHVQPIEIYREGIIMYSLGDLVDDYRVDSSYKSNLGMLVELDTWQQTVKIHPTRISNLKTELLSPKDPDYRFVIQKATSLAG